VDQFRRKPEARDAARLSAERLAEHVKAVVTRQMSGPRPSTGTVAVQELNQRSNCVGAGAMTALNYMNKVLIVAVGILCVKNALNDTNAAEAAADLALRSGAVYTMDGARSWAEAVAIRAGRVVFVGSNHDLKRYIGSSTRVVDLKGRMLMPAFQDSHIHPISAGLEASACNLNGLKTAPEYVAAIKKYAIAHPNEGWITGGGWLMSAFGPGGMARRELIDAVVPNRPVYLSSADGHTFWANTKALNLAHITNETRDPADGRIDRDPKTGAAIGSLQEGASELVSAVVPPATEAQRQEALRFSIKLLNGYGITAIQDAAVYENDLKAYKALDARGELSLRVVAAIWWEHRIGLEQIDNIKRLRQQYTTGRIDARTVKIMQDGIMENYTAVLLEPYLKPGKEYGIPMVDPQRLKQIVTRLDAEGFQVHFHAIGDGAVRQSLDSIEAARRANGDLGHRHHIAHLELVDPADIPRFRELGVIANFQPLWAFADEYITKLTIPFLGPERASRLYPIGSLYRSGAVVAFGSDWSVSSPNPLEEIQVAVTRMGPSGETIMPFVPAERINLPEALAAFTINAAYTNRLETQTGSIEVGKFANLVVLDQNLFAIRPTDISKTHVLVTLFEGRTVHGDLGAL
jgi:predicted amidohydrolase YtcJ